MFVVVVVAAAVIVLSVLLKLGQREQSYYLVFLSIT